MTADITKGYCLCKTPFKIYAKRVSYRLHHASFIERILPNALQRYNPLIPTSP